MATTTTFAAIRDNYITVLEALTPTTKSEVPLRCVKKAELREWAEKNATSAVLRKFDIRRGDGTEPPFQDPSAIERNEDMVLTVAYPVANGLYGQDDRNDMEDLIRSDARQIRDAVVSSDNYLAGQSAALLETLPAPERDEKVWFQVFVFRLIYTEAQSL